MFTLYKKGSLNISVEAIIILILAITMLGLGMGFIKKYFGDISEKLEQQIESQADPPKPTGTNPITLSMDTIIVNPTKKTGLKISLFNPSGIDWKNTQPGISCLVNGVKTPIAAEVLSRDIKSQTFETFKYMFTMPQITPNDYLCQIQAPNVDPLYYEDITVSVRS